MNTRSNSSAIFAASNPRSDSQCDVYVRPTHLRDGRKNKSALHRQDLAPSAVARFHTKYKQGDGCWLWTAGRYRTGYGMFMVARFSESQVNTQAHRVAYVLGRGDIPQGRVVMHACDEPACVNPRHLVLGDQADNIRDASRKGRLQVPHVARRKLTDAQVADVRASRETLAVWADRLGVSVSYLSMVRRGLCRKAA